MGATFIGLSLYSDISAFWQLKQEGIRTVGVVKNKYEASNTEYDATIYEVNFLTDKGELKMIKNHFQRADNRYEIGDSVKVIYLKDDSDVARIDSFMETYGLIGTTLLIGFTLLTIGTVGIVYHEKVDAFISTLPGRDD